MAANGDMIFKIMEYLPDEDLEITTCEITGDITIEINNSMILTVLKNDNWDHIKRHIDVKMGKKEHICTVCGGDLHKRVSCNQCLKYYCASCYIKFFKKNKGIIKCPFCNFSYGKHIRANMIDACVFEIMSKLR